MSIGAQKEYYLGVDCGTQSLKLDVSELQYDASGVHPPSFPTVASISVPYEQIDPSYLHISEDSLVVTTSPLVWLAALDRALLQLPTLLGDLSRVSCVGGSGQQHGAVFWRTGALNVLQHLDPLAPLDVQLRSFFSFPQSPIWMDASTGPQCIQLSAAAFSGDLEKQANVTGSGSYERFTGNQILKLAQMCPEGFAATERVSLVSSFLCSLFLGCYAPIDHADASGTSLFDFRSRRWVPEALGCVGNSVFSAQQMQEDILGEPCPTTTVLDTVSAAFQARYGFSPQCRVTAFSGDNPCTVAALSLWHSQFSTMLHSNDITSPNIASSPPSPTPSLTSFWTISLGTSDTLLALSPNSVHPSAQCGHAMASPLRSDECMVMLCYRNGAASRASLLASWYALSERDAMLFSKFDESLAATPAGNAGLLGFYFPSPEIFPRLASGTHRFSQDDSPVASFPSPAHDVRALLEGRFLGMKAHALGLGLSKPRGIVVTGGGAQSGGIVQLIADVFAVPVLSAAESPHGAAKGAALLAYLASNSQAVLPAMHDNEARLTLPDPSVTNVYAGDLFDRYRRLEQQHFSSRA